MIMDSIIIWNIRGLNDFNKEREIIFFCRKNKLGICGVVEIKIKIKEKVVERLDGMCFGWQGYLNCRECFRGRVWVIWDFVLYRIDILKVIDEYVYCKVGYIFIGIIVFMIFVYGFNIRE